MVNLSSEEVEWHRAAGKAVKAALGVAGTLVAPGTRLLDLCEACEREILAQGAQLAFPTNVSVNNVAAHYTSPPGDQTVLAEGDLVKVDCGAHVEGRVADAARTFVVGGTSELAALAAAAGEALRLAIGAMRPGVKLFQVGEVISRTILERGFRPISNLGGHQLRPYELHGTFVPNVPDQSCNHEVQPGEVYAIEPFATNGHGSVTDGDRAHIYRFMKTRKKNTSARDRYLQEKFKKLFGSFPFCSRWVDLPHDTLENVVPRFVRLGVLHAYKVLVEVGGGLVAQEEDTVLVHADRAEVTTR
ncbi:MAG: type II methionyl aminopeptidase [Promethearchaeota archaeon]